MTHHRAPGDYEQKEEHIFLFHFNIYLNVYTFKIPQGISTYLSMVISQFVGPRNDCSGAPEIGGSLMGGGFF